MRKYWVHFDKESKPPKMEEKSAFKNSYAQHEYSCSFQDTTFSLSLPSKTRLCRSIHELSLKTTFHF